MFELGNPDIVNGTVREAFIDPAIQGIGLDEYSYNQVITLLYSTGGATN